MLVTYFVACPKLLRVHCFSHERLEFVVVWGGRSQGESDILITFIKDAYLYYQHNIADNVDPDHLFEALFVRFSLEEVTRFSNTFPYRALEGIAVHSPHLRNRKSRILLEGNLHKLSGALHWMFFYPPSSLFLHFDIYLCQSCTNIFMTHEYLFYTLAMIFILFELFQLWSLGPLQLAF